MYVEKLTDWIRYGELRSSSSFKLSAIALVHCRVRIWVAGWITLVLLLSTIPYILGLLTAPPDTTFTGALINNMDTFSYYGKMQLGLHGEWGFGLFYTAGADSGCSPFFLLYIALGHVAGLTGLSIPLVYHAARLVCGALLGLAVTQFAARTLSSEIEQRLALALVLFTGGWGWLIVSVFGVNVDRDFIMDLWRLEANGPATLAGFPHFALVVACQIWLVLAGLAVVENPKRRRVWMSGFAGAVAALAIVLIHPHQLLVPGLVLSIVVLRDVLTENQPWYGWVVFQALLRRGIVLLAIVLPAVLMVLYQWVSIQREPQIQSWLNGSFPVSVPLLSMASLYGPVWLLVLLGFWRGVSQRDTALFVAVTWLAIELILLRLPLDVSSRYAQGLYVPVAILAAAGWNRCVASWLSRHVSRLIGLAALPVLFTSVALSSVFFLAMLLARIGNQGNPDYYMLADERAALAWLDDVATLDDAVLSDPVVGNRIPAWAGVRVLVGHGHETLDYDQRVDDVRWFFDAHTADSARIEYLRRFGIDYVYFSPAERALGAFDPAAAPYLTAGFTRGAVTVYVVDLPADELPRSSLGFPLSAASLALNSILLHP